MAWRCSGSTQKALVDNMVKSGIVTNKRVIEAMSLVDRQYYAPKDSDPYQDAPQYIGHNVTISAPHMHAYCLELLVDHLKEGNKALDVGSGSGYLTACFAALGADAYGIDHIKELVDKSASNVKTGNPSLNIQFKVGDGRMGWREKCPFHCIHVGAAAPHIPTELIEQLAEGGRLVSPVGEDGEDQYLMVYDKGPGGKVVAKRVMGVRYVPLTSVEKQVGRV